MQDSGGRPWQAGPIMHTLTTALELMFAGLLATLAVFALVLAARSTDASGSGGIRVPSRSPRPSRWGLALLIAAWTAAVLFMTLRTGSGLGVRLNLVPLIVDGPASALDAVLNTFVFLPLGMLLALAAVRFRWALAAGLALTLTIEISQYLMNDGRTADINDVITNTLGACLGWAVVTAVRWASGRLRPASVARSNTGPVDRVPSLTPRS